MKKLLLLLLAVIVVVIAWAEFRYRWNRVQEDAGTWWENLKKETKNEVKDDLPKTGTETIAGFKDLKDELLGYKEEKRYIVLLQNSMEIRPTGGFIGSFMEISVKEGKITDKKLVDSGVFDRSIAHKAEPIQDIYKDFLPTSYLGTKDSNYWFDFKRSAEKFLEVYGLGEDGKVSGVVGITSNILPSLIELTGPVSIEGIEGEFTKDNVLEKLEYEVEVGYKERGEKKDDRKSTLNKLVSEMLDRIENGGGLKKILLLAGLKNMLDEGKITLYSKESSIQNRLESMEWAGRINRSEGDYLAVVDTNLYALKSDRCIEKNITHKVDLNTQPIKATTSVKYKHTCTEKNFMTTNYRGFLRFYIPNNSSLEESSGFKEEFLTEEEEERIAWGSIVSVPLGKESEYTIEYSLPDNITKDDYSFYYQQQNGVNKVHLVLEVKEGEEEKTVYNKSVTEDIKISNAKIQ